MHTSREVFDLNVCTQMAVYSWKRFTDSREEVKLLKPMIIDTRSDYLLSGRYLNTATGLENGGSTPKWVHQIANSCLFKITFPETSPRFHINGTPTSFYLEFNEYKQCRDSDTHLTSNLAVMRVQEIRHDTMCHGKYAIGVNAFHLE